VDAVGERALFPAAQAAAVAAGASTVDSGCTLRVALVTGRSHTERRSAGLCLCGPSWIPSAHRRVRALQFIGER
jgi:hypothetical protein